MGPNYNGSEVRKKRKGRGVVLLLALTNLFLCAALIFTLILLWQGDRRQEQRTQAAMVQVQSETDALALQLEEAQARIDWLEDNTILQETFKGYAQQYGVSSEFIQKFFPDKMIYKDNTGVVYADIDPELAQNSYDWQYLSRDNGRFSYRPPAGEAAKTGVDVSRHQGDIDWQRVAADGIDFAMIRLGYRGYGEAGKLMMDDNFEQNIEGALAAGLDVGVYFFSQAITEEEVLEEAQLVIDTLKGRTVTYPVVFDMEEIYEAEARTDNISPEETANLAIAFCEKIKEAGYRPMIYGNLKWLVADMEFDRLEAYDKWLAQYYRMPAFPYDFQIWQYSSTGTVDGISGNVDLNLCFTDYPKAP